MKLTLPQQDIYFEQLLYPNDPIYNIGAKIEIKGNLDLSILRSAYNAMINQHETYRSVFIKTDDEVEMEFVKEHNSELGYSDFSTFENPIEIADDYMNKKFSIPFNLFSKEMLHSFVLIKLRDNHYYLFSMYHHIITDGWGTSLMFQRLVQNYNELLAYDRIKTDYPFTYQDFIEDDLQYQNSSVYYENKDYWKQKFRMLPENLFEKINKSSQIFKSERKELIIKREVYDELNALASQLNSSTFNLILSSFYIYFGRKNQNNDFAIGLPVLNRSKAKYKKTVGLFMGVSPLRMQFSFSDTVVDFLEELKKQLRLDYRHQRFPLGKLIKELELFAQKERLFNIVLSYEKQDYSVNFLNTKTSVIPLTHKSERAALSIYIREFDQFEDVKIDFDYNTSYFNSSMIEETINQFEVLIADILTNPHKKICDLNFLPEIEKNKVLFEFNQTAKEGSSVNTILNLISSQAEMMTGKIAVFDDHKSYSYSEIENLSNNIASYILNLCGDQDRLPIAVLISRSADIIPVLLGILKTGRPYIPLDPAFPENRLRHIISDSKAKLMISDGTFEIKNFEETEILPIDNLLRLNEKAEQRKSPIEILPQDSAYIIYTSGTTGLPKGVEISHGSLLNFLTSMQHEPGIGSNDLIFAVTTYSFDISILEFFGPLVSGASLFIAHQNLLSDPGAIIEKINIIKPSIIQATPSFYQMLLNADWKGGKKIKILCGGDSLKESLAEKLLLSCSELWNMYGPTETTIWSSIKKISHYKESSNIGKPIKNTQIYILDDFLKPVAIGTYGFLYIGGQGISKGYYNNENLTAEKFIVNPFLNNDIFYSTGDIGKWNSTGEIEFLGRSDNQFKIRGFRIETGDIENHLNRIDAIKDSAVIAKKESVGDYFLIAYIKKAVELINEEEILKKLSRELPYYMIPQVIIVVDEFPLTPNKKVDKKRLSEMDISKKSNDYIIPETFMEKKLAILWGQVLNYDGEIGLNSNFFALGGHSLSAVRLSRLISEHLSYYLSLKEIFDNPTIGLMANKMMEIGESKQDILPICGFKEFYNLTPSQTNIWIGSLRHNTSVAYNMVSAYYIEGNADYSRLEESVNFIIKKFEILRTNFVEVNGTPYQKISASDKANFKISVSAQDIATLQEAMDQFAYSRFDLEHDLLIKGKVFKLEGNKNILLFATHHIIMDALSLEVFVRNWTENYNTIYTPTFLNEEPLENQFKDYSEELSKRIQDRSLFTENWWKHTMDNFRPKRSFEKDFENSDSKQDGGQFKIELDSAQTVLLKKIAFDQQTTIFTVLISILNLLIYKESHHNDICIGIIDSGRDIFDLDHQIGMFAKTIPLRTKISDEKNFSELLKNIQNNLFELKNYDDFPFDQYPQTLFDALLVYQNPDFSYEVIGEFNDFKLTSYQVPPKYSRVPLVFNFYEHSGNLKCIIDYNASEYGNQTIKFLAVKYFKILEEILKNPLLTAGMIDVRLEYEKKSNLDFEFNF